jgi:hypothetical protein
VGLRDIGEEAGKQEETGMKPGRGGKYAAAQRGAFVRPNAKPAKPYPIFTALLRFLRKDK